MRCPTSAGHLDAVPRKTAGWILERNDEDVGIIRSPLRNRPTRPTGTVSQKSSGVVLSRGLRVPIRAADGRVSQTMKFLFTCETADIAYRRDSPAKSEMSRCCNKPLRTGWKSPSVMRVRPTCAAGQAAPALLLPQPNAVLLCCLPQRTVLACQRERSSFRELEIGSVINGQAVGDREV
jgi:hypothetical protein